MSRSRKRKRSPNIEPLPEQPQAKRKKSRRKTKAKAAPTPESLVAATLQYRAGPRFDFGQLPEAAREIVAICHKRGWPFLIVGGFARDWMAGRMPHDVDMVIVKNGYSMARLFKGEFVHARHPIVLCPGGAQVAPVKSLENYHSGRDFTANALAIDAEGYVLDPVGGLADVKAMQVRQIKPDTVYLDPIRAFRACRLAARLGWRIEPGTAKALDRLGSRRSRKDFMRGREARHALELRKAFEDPKPSNFFRLLHAHNLLGHLLPHLENAWQTNPNLAENAIEACDAAGKGNCEKRMAALFAAMYPDNAPAAAMNMAKFLDEIYWDVVASNFERLKDFISGSELACALAFRNETFTDIESLIKISRSFSGLKPSLKRLIQVVNRAYDRNIPLDNVKMLIGQAQTRLEGKRRQEALRFCGFSMRLRGGKGV